VRRLCSCSTVFCLADGHVNVVNSRGSNGPLTRYPKIQIREREVAMGNEVAEKKGYVAYLVTVYLTYAYSHIWERRETTKTRSFC
jgi:hypothetical protein